MPSIQQFVIPVAVCGLIAQSAAAQLQDNLGEGNTVPTPIQDDANLNDVQFVGSKLGWAVGDYGVIWHTADGGTNWRLVDGPVDCPLRSVCFLTDRVGWIVGGGTRPYTRLGYGVVLFTNDGGRTWQQPAGDALPRLHWVKFFDMRIGMAVGQATSEHPTGVFVTRDGGKTWRSIPGRKTQGWRTASFVHPDVGVVAGSQGRVSLVGGGRLLQPRLEPVALRGMRDVVLAKDDIGWLVGDGGLVLWTENGGVVWQAPPKPLPAELRDVADFRAVAVHEDKVWIAGQPGSVIWHSPDGGRTWTKQFTGQTAPIQSLEFTSAQQGWAVGALGTILSTDDGGNSWKAVRGENRRLAMLAIHTRPQHVSFPLLAKQSWEYGYRSAVLLPLREDIGPNSFGHDDRDVELHEAVNRVAGATGEIDWALPLARPDLDRHSEQLIADWNRRLEGRLAEVIHGRLVRQLRMWRPEVVVLDQPAENDAATALVEDALLRAVEQAGDATRYMEHRTLAGLEPWKVQKVYRRLPPGGTGHAHLEPDRYLPRVGRSAHAAAAPAVAIVSSIPPEMAGREAYRLVYSAGSGRDIDPAAGDLLSGIVLAPGSAARRELLDLDERAVLAGKKLAQRQRNFRAYTSRFLDDDRLATQVIAELGPLIDGMPDDQAALQLAELAREYARGSQWDLVEATLVELVERFPDEPAGHEAMRWLFQFWSGAEPAWQRARQAKVDGSRFSVDADAVRTRVQNAVHQATLEPDLSVAGDAQLPPDPIDVLTTSGELKTGADSEWRNGAVEHWHEQALRMASLMRAKAPALFRTAEVQIPLAATLRNRGLGRLADGYFRRLGIAGENDPWTQTANTELWLVRPTEQPPPALLPCRFAKEPPVLNGVLSDACWQNAVEINLASQDDESKTPPALAMLAFDREYLYLAVSAPRVPGVRADGAQMGGRKHDADLSGFDRVSLYLDVDRDYATYYAFHVDQRGWTAESCWEDASFNPNWFVAADADEERWRIEAAIPLAELVPHAPPPKSYWAVGLVRTIPTVGVQSWTQPASTQARPETFGPLRFD